jgi:hypothetical protein
MSDQLLRDDILAFLHANASGAAHATPRRHLLMYLNINGHSICDRRMRATLSAMPECGSCLKGIFFITNAEDRRVAGQQLHSASMSSLVREKRIREAAPQGQISLFGEEKP